MVDIEIKKEYFKSGALNSEISYSGDMRHGLARWYWSSSNICAQENYINGVSRGASIGWYQDGHIIYFYTVNHRTRHGIYIDFKY